MTSQETSGSFMLLEDVMKYHMENDFDANFWNDIVEIDSFPYLPTSVISERMSEQEWRTMQSKVTTSMFGLEPIIFI
jgi:hypothetical protein